MWKSWQWPEVFSNSLLKVDETHWDWRDVHVIVRGWSATDCLWGDDWNGDQKSRGCLFFDNYLVGIRSLIEESTFFFDSLFHFLGWVLQISGGDRWISRPSTVLFCEQIYFSSSTLGAVSGENCWSSYRRSEGGDQTSLQTRGLGCKLGEHEGRTFKLLAVTFGIFCMDPTHFFFAAIKSWSSYNESGLDSMLKEGIYILKVWLF